jgi:simple sugar transport system permease protein
LQNIDSNVQLVMKGLIIVCTVLVQEQNLGQLVTRLRRIAPPPTHEPAGSAEVDRPQNVLQTLKIREDLDEAS